MPCSLSENIAKIWLQVACGWLVYLLSWQSSSDETSLIHALPHNFSMLLYLHSVLDRFLLANIIGHRKVLSGTISKGQFVPSLICSSPAPSPNLDASVSR